MGIEQLRDSEKLVLSLPLSNNPASPKRHVLYYPPNSEECACDGKKRKYAKEIIGGIVENKTKRRKSAEKYH